ELLVIRARVEWDPLLGRGAGQIVLREIGPIVWHGVVGIDEGDRTFEAEMTQLFRNAVAGTAGADDPDGGGRVALAYAVSHGAGRRSLTGHEHRAITLSDVVGGDRVQRGRAQRLTGPETEACVVPRTPNGVVHDEAFGERATPMGAGGTDGGDLTA